ncbi:hypothetical protein GGTG_07461 [Gaeumannomyces tritici R3-111a-1]|uniref:Uncharacterized protein n=1 Tax=Gaeumannomyces tritici (strain R3-111a-1) TaxID=644352 RepID=J3P1R3_GAET3|nr:hypothetical protein GGTG_07461 [Gaeumannomyces tritici R3-111a-1]EJT73605.1 hypothetical protein GGTG_07461 [Gaeumannomyces tritici R3-111a-1]
MKFLLALVALPAAILAAPVADAATANPPGFLMDSLKCTCQNPATNATKSDSLCANVLGEPETESSSKGSWCYRRFNLTPQMDQLFTDEACTRFFQGNFSKAVCAPVKLCDKDQGPDRHGIQYYKVCGR